MQVAKVFTAANGVDFYVRLLHKGAEYGNGATWDKDETGVAFYDFRWAHQRFGPMGQQVATYYLETILQGWSGLDLDSGIEDWTIDASTMNDIRCWLEEAESDIIVNAIDKHLKV